MVFCCLWKEKTKFISNWREGTSWEAGNTPHSRASWCFLYRHAATLTVGRFGSGTRDLPSVTPWTCLNRMAWADLHQIVAVEEWSSSKAPVFSLTIDNSSGTWPLISFRRQGLKEKWNYRFEQFVPVIVKSISDFIVGTTDLPSIVCTLYPSLSWWHRCCWPSDGLHAAVRAQRKSPAKNHLPESPWLVFCVCV